MNRDIRTPCKYCGKSYKNVMEHITKSHSYIQLTCEEDGEISPRCGVEGEFELFWRDHRYTLGAINDDVDGDCNMEFGAHDDDTGVVIHLTRSLNHPTMWVVRNIDTIKTTERPNGTLYDTRKGYMGHHIQVLHQRLGPE